MATDEWTAWSEYLTFVELDEAAKFEWLEQNLAQLRDHLENAGEADALAFLDEALTTIRDTQKLREDQRDGDQ